MYCIPVICTVSACHSTVRTNRYLIVQYHHYWYQCKTAYSTYKLCYSPHVVTTRKVTSSCPFKKLGSSIERRDIILSFWCLKSTSICSLSLIMLRWILSIVFVSVLSHQVQTSTYSYTIILCYLYPFKKWLLLSNTCFLASFSSVDWTVIYFFFGLFHVLGAIVE
jgi:hypothetical protein